jgi:hypothetical protein
VWTCSGNSEEDGEIVTERSVVSVLNETRPIDGVSCLVFRDAVEVDGALLEDTDDWFAQDEAGKA